MLNLSGEFVEAVRGTLICLYFALILLLGRYLLVRWRILRWSLRQHPESATAVALLTLFCGELMMNFPIWVDRHITNDGGSLSPSTVTAMSLTVSAGVAVTIIGIVCLIRNGLTPAHWGEWPWIVTAAVSLVVGVGVALW